MPEPQRWLQHQARFRWLSNRLASAEFQLVDGGVTDNSAMTLLLDADFESRTCSGRSFSGLADWSSDLVIQSDASHSFDAKEANFGPISAPARAIDTAVARVGMRPIYLEDERLRPLSPPAILLSPDTVTRQKMSVNFNEVWRHFEELDNASVLRISDTLRNDPFENKEFRDWFDYESAMLRAGIAQGANADLSRLRGSIENTLEMEIGDDAATFFRSATLEEHYSVSDGQKLYRLGWLLAMLNGAAIVKALETSPDKGAAQVREELGQYCRY
jgi:hypothetical protein